jgi:hypothetical protein
MSIATQRGWRAPLTARLLLAYRLAQMRGFVQRQYNPVAPQWKRTLDHLDD